MESSAADASKLPAYDPFDVSWWDHREMGSPDDPYNAIPKLSKEDELYTKYVDLVNEGYGVMRKEYESEEGWVYCKETNGVKVWCKDIPDDPVRCFRGTGIVNATPEVLRLHLVQMDLRRHWDPMFLGANFSLEVTPSIRVTYYKFKAPWPVTNRDFVVIAGETLDDDGVFVSVVNSIETPDIPEQEGFVRGELRCSGFVIKPLPNGPKGEPRSQLTYLVQLNPMGWIPGWVNNLVNQEQPLCIDSIRKAVYKTQDMIHDMLFSLFKLPEEDWKADKLEALVGSIIQKYSADPEMILDPLAYIVTGKRKPEVSVPGKMEADGKRAVLTALWKGAKPYAQSLANPELYAVADDYFNKQE
ncbi:START domain containing protein [Balamuthia mandrillaris]